MNMRRRRESVASVYRKTTKFISSNTANLLKKMPNTKKIRSPSQSNAEELKTMSINNKEDSETEDDDLGERDLDYYLGVKKKETYWRDPERTEQIVKDYLLYHCGVSEDDFNKYHKKIVTKTSSIAEPRLKQVPFKIHKKKKNDLKDDSWKDMAGFFKLFAYRRDSEYSTSDSYSECDSDELIYDDKFSNKGDKDNEIETKDVGVNGSHTENLNEVNEIQLIKNSLFKFYSQMFRFVFKN